MAAAPDIDSLWHYADPAGTAASFQALLDEHGSSAGPAWQAQLLSQLARTHGLRADFAIAHALLDQAQVLADAAPAGSETTAVELARVRILLERGRCHNSGGDPADALPFFTEALELASAAGLDNLAVDAAHMLAIAAPGAAGLAWNSRAIAMAEASSDPLARQWLGALLNNHGWGLHDSGDHAAALEWFERSLAYRAEHGPETAHRIARWCIARCLRSLQRTDEALALQQGLLADIGSDGTANEGYTCEEVGECLLALGRGAEAAPHFARAHALLSTQPLLAAREPQRLARLGELGASH